MLVPPGATLADFPIAAFQSALLHWFKDNKRALPWRTEPRAPYHVWLAETMLQQTQVGTVIPYYERWLQRFPTLESLADAPLDDVLKKWEGLGYYSRARNFHQAAQYVVREYAGDIPDTVDQLLKLPGIGRYTAGAIASLAFKVDAPILDGNVSRVLSRVTALAQDFRSPASVVALWDLSARLVPSGHAGEFNEALMDLGATVCTPKAPNCAVCPLVSLCIAYAKGAPESYPVRARKAKTPHRDIATAFIRDATGCVLMAQRPVNGLLGGLWEFPGGEVALDAMGAPGTPSGAISQYADMAAQLTKIIRATTGLQLQISSDDFRGQVKHAFTHFRITRHVAIVSLTEPMPRVTPSDANINVKWVKPEEIGDLALTRSDQKILDLARAALDHPDCLL